MRHPSGKRITRHTYDQLAAEYAKRDRGIVPERLTVLAALKKFIRLVPPNAKVLDVGCGAGRDATFLAARGLRVVGIDFSKGMIAQAKRVNPRIDFRATDFEKLRFRPATFDGVWANASLHHIPKARLKAALNRIHRVLKPGGILFVKVKYGTGEDMRENVKFTRTIRRYFAFYQPKELRTSLATAKFTPISQNITGHGEWLDIFAKKPTTS